MRRRITMAVAGLALVAAASAGAQAPEQRNAYDVRALLGPTKAGSQRSPVNVRLSLDVAIREAADQRPAVVERMSLRVRGLRVNAARLPQCSAARINAAGDARVCPRRSLVATGSVRAVLGRTNDATDQAINCFLRLRVYNARGRRAALFLTGGPTASPSCPDETAIAVGARWTRRAGSTALEFALPPQLRHPRPDLDQAVVELRVTFRRGRYLQAVGGCRAGRRRVEAVLTPEAGKGGGPGADRASARCRR